MPASIEHKKRVLAHLEAEKAAQDFAGAMCRHHETLLANGDEEARDAVIIKLVAITALAFGIPPVAGEPLDVDDAIAKLKHALEVIAKVERV